MLLIESDPDRRSRLAAALRSTGMPVIDVAHLAEVERWPSGDVVVTQAQSFTPLWKHVGASHVVVLADTPAEGIEACDAGATTWMPRTCEPTTLLMAIAGMIGWTQPGAKRTA